MKKWVNWFLAIVVGAVLSGAPGGEAAAQRRQKPTPETETDSTSLLQQRHDFRTGQALETFFNVFREVNYYYVDTLNPQQLIENAANGMLRRLDPYTEYMAQEKMEEFETITTGQYAGLGAVIRQRGEWVEIAEPYQNAPAAKAGLLAGDRIVALDGESMHKKEVTYVSSRLKGKPGTKLSLTIRPITDTSTTRTLEIAREKIQMPAVPYSGWVNDSIGYIRFDNFSENSSAEVRKALTALQQGDGQHTLGGLILDLRDNGGGILGEGVKIASLFVPRGTEIVTMKGRVESSNRTYRTMTDPIAPGLPLTVLINRSSASTSEVLAGALQDLDRAVIVGQRSFGKGLVQATRQIGENEIVKVTIAKYYTPSGRCVQAVDYSHRNEDGSVGYIPDSLIQSFKTKGGRLVYEGGGIMPDAKTDPQYYSKFTAILIGLGYLDDYANRYAVEHSRPELFRAFKISDADYDRFRQFMADKPIDFESATERKLKELKQTAEYEKYADRIGAELTAIAEKIKEDKETELTEFASEIRNELSAMLIGKWYYAAGRIAYELQTDRDVQKAVEILRNPTTYTQIITLQDTEKK